MGAKAMPIKQGGGDGRRTDHNQRKMTRASVLLLFLPGVLLANQKAGWMLHVLENGVKIHEMTCVHTERATV